ncbi:hypothetical protein M6B38_127655 [Iris pallida]|uniref:Uncharacterized protein n=1 Tax=Iris pallida TaxID=29817 RepID=A0AAX6G4N0_IRIPA|nr:hypothetical protein M6B38_127655 [Iris pallida]
MAGRCGGTSGRRGDRPGRAMSLGGQRAPLPEDGSGPSSDPSTLLYHTVAGPDGSAPTTSSSRLADHTTSPSLPTADSSMAGGEQVEEVVPTPARADPYQSDPPCAPQDETRMEIWADGPTKYRPSSVQRALGSFLRSNYGGPWINYSDASEERKAFWFAHFKRTYFYPPHRAEQIERQFLTVATKLIRDAIDDQKARQRSGKPIAGWITPDQWTTMRARFEELGYRERSEKAKAARTMAGKWCGGSIPMTEHFRRLVNRGEDANMVTVFLATHRKDGKLIDDRATQSYEEYVRLRDERASASAQAEGGVGTSQPSSPQSEDELWKTAVGGLQRGTYYGTGSYGAYVTTHASRAPSSSAHSQPSQAESFRVEETIVRQIAELHDDMLRKIAEQPGSQAQGDAASVTAHFDELERTVQHVQGTQESIHDTVTRIAACMEQCSARLRALEETRTHPSPAVTLPPSPAVTLPPPSSSSVVLTPEQYAYLLSRSGDAPPDQP